MAQYLLQLPELQLIGAQKSGTSAIADWLFEHGGFKRPTVFDNEPAFFSKEVHFFDTDYRYSEGVEFYARRFQAHDDPNKMKNRYLDATPDTLPFPERVKFTYEKAGGNQLHTVKFIVILREPISRELSLYNHLAFDCRTICRSKRNDWHNQVIKEDNSIMSFDEFVMQRSIPALQNDVGPGRSTRHSKYATHLSKWFQEFDRKQILLLGYHELKHNPEKVKIRIQEFLGIEIKGEIEQSNVLDSPSKIKAPSSSAKKALMAIFTPLNEKLYKLLRKYPGPPMEEPELRFLNP